MSSQTTPPPPPAPSSSSKLTLHFLDHSRAETILWILEELQVEYEMKVYSRGSNYLAPKELREIHPLGKSPVIVHNSLVIAETGNIISYLLRTFDSHTNGVFSPKDLSPEMDQKNAYYLHYAEGSLMPILVNKLVFSKFPEMSPWYARPIITGFAAQVNKNWLDMELKKHLGMIDGDLQKTGSSSSWFCGGEEPTQADFAMYFPLLSLSKGRAGGLACPESIKSWVAKVEQRPALKAAYAKLDQVEKERDAATATATAAAAQSAKL